MDTNERRITRQGTRRMDGIHKAKERKKKNLKDRDFNTRQL
jgi:hypothetical protein